jgi:hypothetical protein
MKNILVFLFSFILMAASCQKTQKPQDLLPGSWGILDYALKGVDKTSDYLNNHIGYKITFDIKGNFTETWHTTNADFVVMGTWTLEKDNTVLMLVDNDPNSTTKIREYGISNLTATDCKLSIGDEVIDIRKY